MKQGVKSEERRSLVKGLLVAGAAALLGAPSASSAASSRDKADSQSEEILYRETEEFKAYYQSLLD